MCSQKSVLTGRRAALLLALSVLSFCGLSCAPKTTPIASQAHPAPPTPHPVLPRVAARPKAQTPIAFPDLDTSEISSLTFSPNGRQLAFGYGTDAEVTLWNLETGRLAWQRHVDAASGGPVQFVGRGKFLIAQFDDPDAPTPIIVSSASGRLIRDIDDVQQDGTAQLELGERFLVVQGSHDIVTSGKEGPNTYRTIQQTDVWNTRTWRRADHKISIHPGESNYSPPVSVPLTSSGRIVDHPQVQKNKWPPARLDAYSQKASNNDFFVTAGDEGTKGQIEAWDIHLKKRLWTQAMTDVPRVPAISPDGKILAVPTLQGQVYFWNLKTGHLLSKTSCSTDVLRCLAFSPNGRVLAVAGGSHDNAYYKGGDGVRLLDTKTFKLIAVLKSSFPGQSDRTGKVWSLNRPDWLAVLPDLSYVASAGVVKKIRTPGRARDAKIVARFNRPARVRAALRKCYQAAAR